MYDDKLNLKLGVGISYRSSFFADNVEAINLDMPEYSEIILSLEIEEYQL